MENGVSPTFFIAHIFFTCLSSEKRNRKIFVKSIQLYNTFSLCPDKINDEFLVGGGGGGRWVGRSVSQWRGGSVCQYSLWMIPSNCGNMINSFRRLLYRDQTSLLHALKKLGQLPQNQTKQLKKASKLNIIATE